jgi:hypothetical protein
VFRANCSGGVSRKPAGGRGITYPIIVIFAVVIGARPFNCAVISVYDLSLFQLKCLALYRCTSSSFSFEHRHVPLPCLVVLFPESLQRFRCRSMVIPNDISHLIESESWIYEMLSHLAVVQSLFWTLSCRHFFLLPSFMWRTKHVSTVCRKFGGIRW